MDRCSCSLEPSNFCSPDWASLAPDVLRQIFSIRQPLQLDLRLVCRAWASAFMPLLTRLTMHSRVWKHSRLGSSSPADVLRLTKFCNLSQLDLQSLDAPWVLPSLPQLRKLNLGHAQLDQAGSDHLIVLSSIHTLRLEIADTTRLDLTTLQELHSLRCLAVTLRPEWVCLDTFLVDVGERGGLTQLTGFTVLVDYPYNLDIPWHSSKSAQYAWMQNLRSLELAAVRPLYSKHPHQRLPIDVFPRTELQRLCEQAPQLCSLTLTTRSCDVHLAEHLASLTGLTALDLTMDNGRGVQAVEPFLRLPLDVVTSLQFWSPCNYCDSLPFHLCDNLINLTCVKPMTGVQLQQLLQLTQLRSLELEHGIEHSCTPAEISNLGRLTGLTKLQLGFNSCAHPLNGIHAVGKLSRLRQLSLDMPWEAYQTMALLIRDCMGSLRDLDALLGVCISHILGDMSLEPLQGLANLTRLEVLHSWQKHWAVSALQELATLTSLRKLVIPRLADADTPLLASLTQLTHLRMVGMCKASEWFRLKKLRTDTLSKLPQLLYFSIESHD